MLRARNVEFYTFDVKVPHEIPEGKFRGQSYKVQNVTWMKGRNKPLSMVLVDERKEYESIFAIKNCCGLMTQTESLNKTIDVIQWKNYLAKYSCMKCGNSCSTYDFTKRKTTPAKCVPLNIQTVQKEPQQLMEEKKVNITYKKEKEEKKEIRGGEVST